MCSNQIASHDLCLLDHAMLIDLSNGHKSWSHTMGNLKLLRFCTDACLVVPNFRFNFLSIKRLYEKLTCLVKFAKDSYIY